MTTALQRTKWKRCETVRFPGIAELCFSVAVSSDNNWITALSKEYSNITAVYIKQK